MRRRSAPYPLFVRAARIGLAFLLPLASVGCAAIPLATLGTVADIAGSAAAAGPAVYQMGKLDIAYFADFATVQRAVRLAAYDLRMIVLDDPNTRGHAGTWPFRVQDVQNSKITITVDPRWPAQIAENGPKNPCLSPKVRKAG